MVLQTYVPPEPKLLLVFGAELDLLLELEATEEGLVPHQKLGVALVQAVRTFAEPHIYFLSKALYTNFLFYFI